MNPTSNPQSMPDQIYPDPDNDNQCSCSKVWALSAEVERLHNIIGNALPLCTGEYIAECRDVLALAESSRVETTDAKDASRWRFVRLNMCYSFDGQDRTHYLKAYGRESFEETVDRRLAVGSPEEPTPGTLNVASGEVTPVCPGCSQSLHRVTRPSGSMLNDEQFDAVRAGDWYCAKCPSNGRGNTKYRYFWSHELQPGNGSEKQT